MIPGAKGGPGPVEMTPIENKINKDRKRREKIKADRVRRVNRDKIASILNNICTTCQNTFVKSLGLPVLLTYMCIRILANLVIMYELIL